jgi:hypothetical protein
MATPINIVLDPALQALMPENNNTITKMELPSALPKPSRKRSLVSRICVNLIRAFTDSYCVLDLSSISISKPKNTKTAAAKPKPPKKLQRKKARKLQKKPETRRNKW